MDRQQTFEIDPKELWRLYNDEAMSTVAIAKAYNLKQKSGH